MEEARNEADKLAEASPEPGDRNNKQINKHDDEKNANNNDENNENTDSNSAAGSNNKNDDFDVFGFHQKLKNEGDEFFRSKEYERANLKYVAASRFLDIKQGPEFRRLKIQCLTNAAACYLQLGEFESCATACAAACELDPQNVKAWIRRAKANFQLQKYEESVEEFTKALELVRRGDPQDRNESNSSSSSSNNNNNSNNNNKEGNERAMTAIPDAEKVEKQITEELRIARKKMEESKSRESSVYKNILDRSLGSGLYEDIEKQRLEEEERKRLKKLKKQKKKEKLLLLQQQQQQQEQQQQEQQQQ